MTRTLDPRLADAWGRSVLSALAVVAVCLPLGALTVVAAEDWDELAAIMVWAAVGVGGVLLAQLVVTWNRLQRRGAPYAAQIALTTVPVTLVLGALTAGLGAVLAVPVAWWLVRGLRAPARPGWGAPTTTLARWRASGVPARLVVAVVTSALLGSWALDDLGHRLGGRLHGEWLVLAALAPVLAIAPVLLLVRRAWLLALAVPTLGLVLAVPLLDDATRFAHPSQDLLVARVEAAGLPDGARAAERLLGARTDPYDGEELPVVVVHAQPVDGAPEPLPPELRPGAGARFPTQSTTPAATDAGRDLAWRWSERLLADGWELSDADRGSFEGTSLPGVAPAAVADPGTVRLEQGLWVRTYVVPAGDGAVLVLVTRP